MLNTEFAIVDDDVPYVIQPNNVNIKPPNLTSYKIVFNALNDNMFKAGESDGNQMYGMRHSARFMVHNVICKNNKDEIFAKNACSKRGRKGKKDIANPMMKFVWEFRRKCEIRIWGPGML